VEERLGGSVRLALFLATFVAMWTVVLFAGIANGV
jgi:hypothetical protein